MTIAEALAMVDALKPSKWTSTQKIKWLSDADSAIFDEIISTHEADDTTPTSFVGYTSETETSTVLLAPAPYDQLYRWYLESQIDLSNMELGKYNNSAALYTAAYQSFAAYYNRKHIPLQSATYFNVGGSYAASTAYSVDPI